MNQVHKAEPVDVAAVLTDMERALRRVIGEATELTLRTTPVPPVNAERGQIEQVMLNLAASARDALPEGGALRIDTAEIAVQANEASYPGVAAGQYVAIGVCGAREDAPADAASQPFEPLFTMNAATDASGAGLATVHAIVTQCRGYVSATRTPRERFSFRVLLPSAAYRPRTARRGFASLPRGTETVLLVEDEHGVRELIRDFLTRCGYSVIEAPQVAEAIALFETVAAEVSLLITDVVMPQMNGRMLAERLMRSKPALKVLYISGYTDDQVLVQEVAGGAGFLQKPFTPDVLARKVRDVLDAPAQPDR